MNLVVFLQKNLTELVHSRFEVSTTGADDSASSSIDFKSIAAQHKCTR
jgi:hypothetical protein